MDNDSTSGAGSNIAGITISKASTTSAITTDLSAPSVTGQPVTVNYTVTGAFGNSPTAPTGNVTVSDGTNSCTASVAAGSCAVTFTSPGSKTLTATYAGDGNFSASPASTGIVHNVNKAETTTTITSDAPDPSVVGQLVTFNYSTTVNAPGAGTPSGNVTVTDGTNSCTGTVAAGSCTITFTAPSISSFTASYPGDANFNGSASASASHTVNKASTTTTITLDSPDPSALGQVVTVNFTVAVTAPGAGTPAGNVTISDSVDSCLGTVASGTCNITLTTGGARTLTATYAGDSNFSGSTSAGEAHMVNRPNTTIASINLNRPTSTNAGSVSWTVTFADAISGLTNSNFTLVNGGLGGTPAITGVGAVGSAPATQWTVTASTGSGNGTLGLNLVNDTGLSRQITTILPFTGQVYTIDHTAPTVAMSDSGAPNPTHVSPIPVTAQFSETVTGFDAGDITPANSTIGNFVAVDGDTYTFDLIPSGQGTLTADIAAGKAADTAGNGNTVATQFSRTYDSVAPTVTISSAASDPTNITPIPVTVQFSEPVTGFTLSDINQSAGITANGFVAVDGANYTFNLLPNGQQGLLTADIAADAAIDAAGNGNTAATQFNRTYDNIAPTVNTFTVTTPT